MGPFTDINVPTNNPVHLVSNNPFANAAAQQEDDMNASSLDPLVQSEEDEEDPHNIPEDAVGWEPCVSDQELYVPLAETWHYHRFIKNRHGQTIFCLLKEEQIGRLIPSSSGEPILRMIVGDSNGQVVAVIVREAKHGKDGYTVYGPRSAVETLLGTTDESSDNNEVSHSGFFHDHLIGPIHRQSATQEHAPYPFQYHPQESRDDSDITLELYPIVSVVQGVLGKTYTVQSHDANRTIHWRADNGQFRKTLLCCPWCIVMGICMWQFEFQDMNFRKSNRRKMPWRRRPQVAPGLVHNHHDANRSSSLSSHEGIGPVVLIRDQEIRAVSVAAGTSPLLALCVTYAMDRLTRPLL